MSASPSAWAWPRTRRETGCCKLRRIRCRQSSIPPRRVVVTVDTITGSSEANRPLLRTRVAALQAVLQADRHGRMFLNKAPWYLVLGPPGAGKTTALLQAALRFSLAAELGQDPSKVPGPS